MFTPTFCALRTCQYIVSGRPGLQYMIHHCMDYRLNSHYLIFSQLSTTPGTLSDTFQKYHDPDSLIWATAMDFYRRFVFGYPFTTYYDGPVIVIHRVNKSIRELNAPQAWWRICLRGPPDRRTHPRNHGPSQTATSYRCSSSILLLA